MTHHQTVFDSLQTLCAQAMAEGRAIDLKGCNYGETTGCCQFINRPTRYYHFLAGLVRVLHITQILEIGTNYGGAIMSMSKALHQEDKTRSKLVTIDIACKNQEGFRGHPHIQRITGDSLDNQIIQEVFSCFAGPIDLLFIDSLHEYHHTKKNIGIYAKKLNPQFIVLDDIRQCDSMATLWNELTGNFKENAFDASEIVIRKGAGFGIIRYRHDQKD